MKIKIFRKKKKSYSNSYWAKKRKEGKRSIFLWGFWCGGGACGLGILIAYLIKIL